MAARGYASLDAEAHGAAQTRTEQTYKLVRQMPIEEGYDVVVAGAGCAGRPPRATLCNIPWLSRALRIQKGNHRCS